MPDAPTDASEGSVRVRLAHVARRAALCDAGVVDLAGGPLRSTAQGGRAVEGVVVAAQGDGCHELTVHLIARPVALAELGRRVRAGVLAGVEAAGLMGELGAVHVTVAGLLADEQLPKPAA
ncbi:MAG: hypothetical protein MSC31_08140 [Solirubrobacteraceae bacterium MAG38_C4-C5]|nr:hypothetical protein [Candidatus Siliceabacter maunaloa]